MLQDQIHLVKKHLSGSSLFGTIAVLSLINLVIGFTNLNVMFPVGLGTALFGASLYSLAPEFQYEDAVRFIGLFFLLLSLVIIGLLFFFGKKAKEGKSWAYITGMIIYFGDALLCAWLEDWISVGFHAWGLFSIWSGFSALKALKNLESQETPETLELQG